MKFLLALLLFSSLSFQVIAQVKFPVGCYLSFQELRDREPSGKCDLAVEKKSKGKKFVSTGNDFILSPLNGSISAQTIKDEIWAYSNGSNLYVNGEKMQLYGDYAKVITDGRFWAFYGTKRKQGFFEAAAPFSDLDAWEKFLYAIDLKACMVDFAEKEYLIKILLEFPELAKSYKKEISRESDETILKYINLCNQTK